MTAAYDASSARKHMTRAFSGRPRAGRLWPLLTLRTLLVAVLAAVALIPLGVFWSWSQSVAFQREVNDVTDRHLLIARNLSAALSRYGSDVLSAFHLLSENAARTQDMPGADALMANLGFRCICIVAADGSVQQRIEIGEQDCPVMFPADRHAALSAYLDDGPGPVFTPVMADARSRPSIYLLMRRDDGALVLGSLATDYFVELGQSIAFGHRGHAAIVDSDGNVLAHPLPSWVAQMRNLAKVPPVARMMAGETGISQFYSPALEDDMIAGFTSVSGTGWGVMIPQPMSELRDAASAANRSATLILAATLVAAAAIGWLLAVRFTAPLRSVIDAARRMAGGDAAARVTREDRLLTTREFAELQAAFNAMADSVQRAKNLEETARDAAVSASQAKSMFLANTSHELRTPLNAIIGFSDVMRNEVFGPVGCDKYRGYVADIRHSADHLRRLINDLLDISSFDLGKVTLTEADAALSTLLRDVETMTRHSAEAKDITLTFRCECDRLLHVDPSRLCQVLINLIANAVRFTPEGGHVDVLARLEPDGRLVLQVADDGPGISPEELSNVLEPFQRGETATVRSSEGVGLGLAIADAIARAHHGTLALESEPGQGTRASLTLPAKRILGPVDPPRE